VCPAPQEGGGGSVADIDAQERLDYLARAFDREIGDIDTWSWTWGGIYTAAAVVQGALIPGAPNHGQQVDLVVGTGSAAFGALALTLLPLQLTLPLRSARGHWGDPDRCATLARAERALFRAEKDQALATGILGHVGNVVVNAGLALLLGLGYGRWSSAALNGGIGLAVGETNAFTQPHHLADVVERYRSGRFDLRSPRLSWAVAPVLSTGMAGLELRARW